LGITEPGGLTYYGAEPAAECQVIWCGAHDLGARFDACIRGNLVAWPTRGGRKALRVPLPERVAEGVATVLVMRTDCLMLQDLGKGREGALDF
jgi:hypothetical protein